jgi:RsiW-degrading membrane proteinase PrsW (M82 family)
MTIFILASIAPAIFIMYLIYRHDMESEPFTMVIKAFLGGVLSVFISFLFSTPLSMLLITNSFLSPLMDAFLAAAIPEELSKWLIFIWLIKKSKHFDQYYDGILYAIFISMGFALIENILYVVEGGLGIAFFRAIFAVPGHMLFAIPMGYYFSLSRFESGNDAFKHKCYSLLIPIILHGIYNSILMYMNFNSDNVFIILIILVLFTYFQIKLWRYGLNKIKLNKDSDLQNSTWIT